MPAKKTATAGIVGNSNLLTNNEKIPSEANAQNFLETAVATEKAINGTDEAVQLSEQDSITDNTHTGHPTTKAQVAVSLPRVVAEQANSAIPEQVTQQFGNTAEDKIHVTAELVEEQQVHQVVESMMHAAESTAIATNNEQVPTRTIDVEVLVEEIDRASTNQEFAEIGERFDNTEGVEPVPVFAPDAEAVLRQLDFNVALDEDRNPIGVEAEGDLVEFVQTDNEDSEELVDLLSEADLDLLKEWAFLMVDAQPEDFAVSTEDEMSLQADYQQLLEQIDGTAGATAGETVTVVSESVTDQVLKVEAGEASEIAINNEVEIPATVTPALAVAVEQISEYIAMLDFEEVAETHILLADVSRELQAVERIILNLGSAAKSVAKAENAKNAKNVDVADAVEEAEEAEVALVQSLQKLCEHIGLDYSEEQITQLVHQLLQQQVGTINLHGPDMVGSAEINQIDLNTGTHEVLSWFMSSIKQLKKQTNWMHLPGLLGRRIMAAIPDVFAVT